MPCWVGGLGRGAPGCDRAAGLEGSPGRFSARQWAGGAFLSLRASQPPALSPPGYQPVVGRGGQGKRILGPYRAVAQRLQPDAEMQRMVVDR